MAAPPDDVTPEELFLKLTEARPSAIIDWPTKEKVRPKDRPAKVRVMVLPGIEHERAGMEGRQQFKARYNLTADDMKDPSVERLVADAAAREIIAACVYHVRPFPGSENEPGGARYPRMFRDAGHVNELSAHEIAVLFRAYQLTQETFGPYEGGSMDRAEAELWLRRLVEGGSAFPLLSLPLPQLVALSSSWAEKICGLCGVLASQWPSLPPTLKSDLQGYFVDTSLFGKHASELDPSSLEESDKFDDPILSADEPLDVDDAIAIAERLRGGD